MTQDHDSPAGAREVEWPHVSSAVSSRDLSDAAHISYLFEGGTYEDICAAVAEGYFTTTAPDSTDKENWDVEDSDYARLKNVVDADGNDRSGDYIVQSADDGKSCYLEKIEAIPADCDPEAPID